MKWRLLVMNVYEQDISSSSSSSSSSSVGQTVGSISSKTLAYDCLYTLELCTASLIPTGLLGHLGDFLPSVCPSCS